MYMCICVYVYMCICVYVHMCIYGVYRRLAIWSKITNRPADGARNHPERPLGMKKNNFPIFFLKHELPVNLSLILRLVVIAMNMYTRSKFGGTSFFEYLICSVP